MDTYLAKAMAKTGAMGLKCSLLATQSDCASKGADVNCYWDLKESGCRLNAIAMLALLTCPGSIAEGFFGCNQWSATQCNKNGGPLCFAYPSVGCLSRNVLAFGFNQTAQKDFQYQLSAATPATWGTCESGVYARSLIGCGVMFEAECKASPACTYTGAGTPAVNGAVGCVGNSEEAFKILVAPDTGPRLPDDAVQSILGAASECAALKDAASCSAKSFLAEMDVIDELAASKPTKTK